MKKQGLTLVSRLDNGSFNYDNGFIWRREEQERETCGRARCYTWGGCAVWWYGRMIMRPHDYCVPAMPRTCRLNGRMIMRPYDARALASQYPFPDTYFHNRTSLRAA